MAYFFHSQTRKSTSFLTKQNAIDEKQEFENSLDDDPLLAFLKDDKQKTPPWKVQKTNESNSFQIGLFGRESTSKKKVTFEPNTIDLSPQEESSFRTTQSQPQSDSPKQPQHSPKSVTDTVTLDTLSALSGKREVKDLTPKPAPRRSSEEDLLKPLPKSRRRHDSNRSSIRYAPLPPPCLFSLCYFDKIAEVTTNSGIFFFGNRNRYFLSILIAFVF